MRKHQLEYFTPSYIGIKNFISKKQFFIYEFDTMLNILQKVKIPKEIFKDYVQKFDHWEFESLRPFRLNRDGIAYFVKHCNFKPINADENCIDVYIDMQSYSLIDIPNKKITKVSREFFQHSCKKVFREYPHDLDLHSLRMIAQILNQPLPKNIFLTEKHLSLCIQQDEDIFSFKLQSSKLYKKIFNYQFKYFYNLSLNETLLFLQENNINFELSKDAKSSIGYNIADTKRDIQVIFQYDEHFEIHIPNKKQQITLERLFYKPLPNMNFFLVGYALGKERYITPNLYFNLYGDNKYYRIKFNLNLFSVNTLKKIFSSSNGYQFNFGCKISNKDKHRIQKKLNLDIGDNECYLELIY
ncbi:hypothetical protein [Helicobacter cholecystus]|uniref:hypothetical protein n=1 Tax=Helicobacter cholecystus TaxID=45498 RepID=UPI0027395808|nr:hypothetical protein [Helicobacter cholecystus]